MAIVKRYSKNNNNLKKRKRKKTIDYSKLRGSSVQKGDIFGRMSIGEKLLFQAKESKSGSLLV